MLRTGADLLFVLTEAAPDLFSVKIADKPPSGVRPKLFIMEAGL